MPQQSPPPAAAPRIAVTGSSGLIGSALTDALRADGTDVVRLVRRPPGAADERWWDPSGRRQETTAASIAGCDAVVHLAGAGVADHRWTARYKQELRDSRVLGTAAIAAAIAALPEADRPRVLVCGSAIGWYGNTGTDAVDEDAPAGTGFLADVCRDWEAAALPARDVGVRTVYARTGLVVARSGGAWGKLFPLFKAGLGGRLGDGNQFWSAISLADHIAALRFLLADEPGLSGPVNLTGPHPVTNREATRVMGEVLRRPTVFTAPAPLLRVVLGEFSDDVLGSQRVLPRRLLESGFTFRHPTVEDAVRAALDTAD